MPSIRCRMVNDGEIPWPDHERFVASLGSRDDVGYYAVMHGGEFIGSVNLHYSESGEVERGIYLHPDHIGRGHATALLRPLYGMLAKSGRATAVVTRVKTDNAASNRLERRLGATLCETTSDGYNIYRLDLRRRRVVLRADAARISATATSYALWRLPDTCRMRSIAVTPHSPRPTISVRRY